MFSSAAAHATAWPPKVSRCDSFLPASVVKTSATLGRQIVAAIGA